MKDLRKFTLLFLTSSFLFASPPTQKNMSPEQMAAQNKTIVQLAATEISKELPKKIDPYTNFVSVQGKETTLVYTFEINTGAKNDKAVISDDKKRMEKAVTNGVCRSSKRFLDAQIDITYIYKSEKTKATLFQFDMTQAKCFKLLNNRY